MERIESLAVVVPCYNAGSRVRPVAEGLLELAGHVLVVDDGCTDESIESLDGLPVRIVALPHNQGKGFAMLEGFRAALEDPGIVCVAIVDADGQHDPNEIPALFDTFLQEGADLVIGSRTFDLEQVPWRSRLGNEMTALVTRLLLRRKVPDTQSGFRLHSRRFLEDILATVHPGRYETEMEILVKAVRQGYTFVAAPIATIYEEGNPTSHFSKLRDSFRIYHRLFVAALSIPRKSQDGNT